MKPAVPSGPPLDPCCSRTSSSHPLSPPVDQVCSLLLSLSLLDQVRDLQHRVNVLESQLQASAGNFFFRQWRNTCHHVVSRTAHTNLRAAGLDLVWSCIL